MPKSFKSKNNKNKTDIGINGVLLINELSKSFKIKALTIQSKKLPLVFWHGYGQSSMTWETTADGREGFQNIFLRRRFPVFLIDQPRRGKASRGSSSRGSENC